jgi:hypothetical protein
MVREADKLERSNTHNKIIHKPTFDTSTVDDSSRERAGLLSSPELERLRLVARCMCNPYKVDESLKERSA